jgi:DNA modification methylase
MSIPMTELCIEHLPLDALIPYARNAREHSDAQVAQIAGSIAEFGFVNPILVDARGVVIAGHGRLLAARQLGLSDVPALRLGHLTETQRRALTIADNRIAESATWNAELLALELKQLDDESFDLDLLGFDSAEIDRLLADASTDIIDAEPGPESDSGEEGDDEPPPTTATAVARAGDIWQLGDHRLACGDAGDRTLIDRLMQGESAALCFTSPPYAQQRNYTGGTLDWDTLMHSVFTALPMADDGQVLVNLGLVHRDNEVIPYWDDWLRWMRTQGWRRFAWYVWDQGPGMPGDWAGRLAPSFEFVFHFNRQSRKPNKIVPCRYAGQETHLRADGSSTAMRAKDGDIGGWSHAGTPTQDHRIPDSVLRITRQKGKIGEGIDHPAVFPIALPEFVMQAYSDAGSICFEPFCGSGTSLLAAQRCGRALRAVELAPEYVDVAIERFRRAHPEQAITLLDTGEGLDAVADRRGRA